MKRFIEVDDRTNAGKVVLAMVGELHKTAKSVKILPSKEEMQKAYETAFIKKMKEAEKKSVIPVERKEALLKHIG